MIAGGELRRWAEDKAGHRRLAALDAAFEAQWRSGATYRRFLELTRSARSPSASGLAQSFMGLFRDDAWIDDLVGTLADQLRSSPYFQPPFTALRSDVHSGLVVFEDQHVSVTVGLSRAGQLAAKKAGKSGGSINFSGQVHVLKFVKAGSATLSFWEIAPIGGDFAASGAGLCRRAGTRRIEDGELLVIDGRSQSYVIDHAAANILVVQAALKVDQAAVAAEYDSVSGVFLGCSATNDADSRLQMLTTLLRKLGRTDSFPTIAGLLDHASFFVRWHAMRELIGLDATRAIPLLRKLAANDAHRDVRQAAASALAAIERALDERKAA